MKKSIEQRIQRQAKLAHARRRVEFNEEESPYRRDDYRASMEATLGRIDWREEQAVEIPVSTID